LTFIPAKLKIPVAVTVLFTEFKKQKDTRATAENAVAFFFIPIPVKVKFFL
jgi:hypothetical protein